MSEKCLISSPVCFVCLILLTLDLMRRFEDRTHFPEVSHLLQQDLHQYFKVKSSPDKLRCLQVIITGHDIFHYF